MKEKLTSRKFWCAIGGYASCLLAAFNVGDNTVAQVSIIISGIGMLAVYIFAQGKIDCEKEKHKNGKQ